jgi:hypothetical protein
MTTPRTALGCVLLGCALAACGAKEKDEAQKVASAEKAIAGATPKIAHIDEILEDAKKRPIVMGRDLKLAAAGQAGFLYLDDANDPLQGSLKSCPELVKKSAKDAAPSLSTLEACARVTHVIVMHERSLSAPTVSQFDKTFNPGLYDGDAYVYELESGKYVGAFEVRAVSSASMKVPSTDAEAKLKQDLMTNAEKAALATFAKAAP